MTGNYVTPNNPNPFPFYTVNTKKLFDFGSAENGRHVEDMRASEVWLDVWGRHTTSAAPCSVCGRQINPGDVFGNGQTNWHGFGRFCMDCVTAPDDKVEGWKVSYKMKRKSRKNPDGIKTFTMVAEPAKMNLYLESIISTFGNVTIEKIWPLSPDEKRERLHGHLENLLGTQGAKAQALTDLVGSVIP